MSSSVCESEPSLDSESSSSSNESIHSESGDEDVGIVNSVINPYENEPLANPVDDENSSMDNLNVAKTEFILIGSKPMIKSISNRQPNIIIENKPIKQVYDCKTLGVTVDQHLSWKNNTETICKKITSGISALRQIK